MKTATVASLQEIMKICQPFLSKNAAATTHFAYTVSKNAVDGPWEQSPEALRTTVEYVHSHLHHPCYLLCVDGDGRPAKFIKLESPKQTAPVFKEALAKLIVDSRHRREMEAFLKRPLRVMQCILKPLDKRGETSFSKEYAAFFRECRHPLPPGVFLLNLTDAVILHKEGVEPFTMVTGNRPLPEAFLHRKFLPILSSSASTAHWDVAIPNYDDIMPPPSKQPKFVTNWQQKTENRAVFRGGPTGCGWTVDTNARLKAAHLSTTTLSDLLDAGIVGAEGATVASQSVRVDPEKGVGRVDVETLETVPRMSMEEQSRYKYILHIDGNVHAYRLLTTMMTGSLLLRVDSPYRGWLDEMLTEGTHYIGIRADLSDLGEKIEWCRKHDRECAAIAKRGLEFAQQVASRHYVEGAFAKIMRSTLNTTAVTTNNNAPCNPLIRAPRRSSMVQAFYESSRSTVSAAPVAALEFVPKPATGRCPKGYVAVKKDKTRCIRKK
jgi:hypothetical protein